MISQTNCTLSNYVVFRNSNFFFEKVTIDNVKKLHSLYFNINKIELNFSHELMLVTSGAVEFKEIDITRRFNKNELILFSINSFKNLVSAPQKTMLEFYRLSISNSFINNILINDSYTINNFNKKVENYMCINCNQSIPSEIMHILFEIENCEYVDFYKQKFIEIKLQELCIILIQQYSMESCDKYCFLKQYQIEKIKKVKSIIENKINESCSLLQLSRQVGLNDCTLKKGFKEVYKKTVFSYLFDLRMNRAVELLRENELSINEIAEEVGYRVTSSFIVAFKKKFGCSPKKFTK